MKRSIFLFALLITIRLYGQDEVQKFTFGPALNGGISQVIFVKTDTIPDHSIQNKVQFSFQAGAFANYDIGKRFSVGLELLYWWQNGKARDQFSYVDPINNKGVDQTNEYKAHLSYVALPVYFQYYVSDVILMLGVQSGFKFGESGSLQVTTTEENNTTEGDKTSVDLNLINFDIGFNAGVLYKLSENLIAGVEYYNGRENLSKNSTYPYSSRNQYFYGALRYNIIHGKPGKMYYN